MAAMIAAAGLTAMVASCFLRHGPMEWGLLWGVATHHSPAGKFLWIAGAAALTWAILSSIGM